MFVAHTHEQNPVANNVETTYYEFAFKTQFRDAPRYKELISKFKCVYINIKSSNLQATSFLKPLKTEII